MLQETNRCSKCKKTFLISTHFQSCRKSEGVIRCKLCRNRNNRYKDKPTSTTQKRRAIYLSHKRKQIEKSRGCEWNGCRFNFSDKFDSFIVCNEVKNIIIFDFDHIQEKLFYISQWVDTEYKTYNEEQFIDEISKCRVLCSFHHHIHSQNQRIENNNNKSDYSDNNDAVKCRKKRQENHDKVTELKLNPKKFGKCEICERPVFEGETVGFDFDHILCHTKYQSISYMAKHGYSWEKRILPEIEKCQLLCTNCHRIRTQKQYMESKNENITIVSRKRKRYILPRNKEELKIRDKGERPTKEELYALVLKYSFNDVGKMYSVGKTAITNWCKKEGLPHTRIKLMEILNET